MMKVYIGNLKYPTVIETNLIFAIPYWTKRKKANPNIHWKIENV